MEELKNKLKEYGFYDFQIEELLKKGKIKTSHGTYILNKNTMTLTLDEKTKEF